MRTQAKPRIQSIYDSRDEEEFGIGATWREAPKQYTKRSLRIRNFQLGRLVSKRHDSLIAAAEGRYVLKSAIRLFQQHHRSVAEYSVTAFRHVPSAALARMLGHSPIRNRRQRRGKLRARQRQCQE